MTWDGLYGSEPDRIHHGLDFQRGLGWDGLRVELGSNRTMYRVTCGINDTCYRLLAAGATASAWLGCRPSVPGRHALLWRLQGEDDVIVLWLTYLPHPS